MAMNAQREFLELKRLLSSWKLEHLLQHLLTEGITIEVLNMMKLQHIPAILHHFPLGDQIRFEFNLENWRQTVGRPLRGHSTAIGTPPNSIQYDDGGGPSPRMCSVATQTAVAAPKIPTRGGARNNCSPTTTTLPSSEQSAPPPLPSPAVGLPPMHIHPHLLTPYARPLPKPSHNINLRGILESCVPRGPQLLRDYGLNKRFQHGQRGELISVLASYFDDNAIHLSLQMSYELEKEILELFPTERLDDYRTEKRGKIYMRVCNMKHYKRKARRMLHSSEERSKDNDDDLILNYDDETAMTPGGEENSWNFEMVDFAGRDTVKREMKDESEEEENVCL